MVQIDGAKQSGSGTLVRYAMALPTLLGIVTLDDVLALLGEELSELGKTVSQSFLRKTIAACAPTRG